jgi:hypothetical protein
MSYQQVHFHPEWAYIIGKYYFSYQAVPYITRHLWFKCPYTHTQTHACVHACTQLHGWLPYQIVVCVIIASQHPWFSIRSKGFWSPVTSIHKCIVGSHLWMTEWNTSTCMDDYVQWVLLFHFIRGGRCS